MRGIDVGELDCLVTFRIWQDMPVPSGSVDPTVDAGQQAWARIEPVGAALFYGTAQIEPGVTHRLGTWRTAALNERTVTASHVVDYDGLRYRVKRATNMDQERMFLLVDLELLGTINA